MKEYPSIESARLAPRDQYCYAFRKYDGSNLRVSWSKKRGWHQWGTRRRMFDVSDPEYGPAIAIFEEKYAEPLAKAINDYPDFKKPREAIAFMEFFGPHSFAGWHDPKSLNSIGFNIEHNDPKDVVVFDVNIHKKGFVGPKDFIKAFDGLHVAEVVWQGFLTDEFIEDVRQSRIVTGEGVVVKGGNGFNHSLWMAKIKTLEYLEQLKRKFGVGGWERYWE